jgi:hypothetical protein
MWDNYIGASRFSIDFKAELSNVFLDCEVKKVDSVFGFLFHGELEGGCGSVELVQYLIDVSYCLAKYEQNVIDIAEVADDFCASVDSVEGFVFHILKV